MNTVSASTRELYHSLRSEVIGVHYRVRVLRQFFTSQETVDLLNKTAIRFFTTLKLDLLDTIVLSINRLLDPAKSFNRFANASLQQLIDSMDPTIHLTLVGRLRALLDQTRLRSARLENWRDKWAAHRDLGVLRGQIPQPAISLPEIDEVLDLIGKFMNEFERVCRDPRVEFDYDGTGTPEEFSQKVLEWERLKIGPPLDYANLIFQDGGESLIDLIKRAKSS
jgi:hypothetical protein